MSETNPHNEPVIDWEIGIKLAGNNRAFALDMLKLFVKTLPDEVNAIIQATHSHNTAELLLRLHKLRGAISYCGLPRLKKTLHDYEKEAKKANPHHLDHMLAQLEKEVTLVIDHVGRITE